MKTVSKSFSDDWLNFFTFTELTNQHFKTDNVSQPRNESREKQRREEKEKER
jgi:hypothetical protein